MAQEKLTWFPVNLSDPKATKAYEALKAANAKAREAREAFEDVARPMMQKHAPEGHEPVFSYRFGKLNVAFREKSAETGKGATTAVNGIKL